MEHIVRAVFGCDRFGVMGIADADHLERLPFDAATAIFSPLYKDREEIPEIDDFVDHYNCYFTFDDYIYDENKVKQYIDELRKLERKYC